MMGHGYSFNFDFVEGILPRQVRQRWCIGLQRGKSGSARGESTLKHG